MSQTITRSDFDTIKRTLQELFASDSELKDACEASSLDLNDDRVHEALNELLTDQKLNKPKQVRRTTKDVLAELQREYAGEEADSAPEPVVKRDAVTAAAKPLPAPARERTPTLFHIFYCNAYTKIIYV